MNAQSPFIWGRVAHNPPNQNASEGWAVAADKNGNVFATGQFDCTSVSFGPYTLNNPWGSYGYSKLYLVKYDSSGNISWAKTLSGEQQSAANSIACDDSGNVYLAGRYEGGTSVVFSPLTVSNTNAPKFFLAKYDPNGNALWVQSMGHQYFSTANAVTIDKSGNIYLAAGCSDTTVVFDTITVGNTYPGWPENYLAKYNPAGHPLWVRHFGSGQFTGPTQLCTDTSGYVYLTGRFRGAKMVIGTDTLINAGTNTDDIYITKFSSAGNSSWSKSMGGNFTDMESSICIDKFGNLYMGGDFASTTISLGPNTFTNSGYTDAFILKMNSSDGKINWSQATGGVNYDHVHSVCTDTSTHIFFTGGYDIANGLAFPYKINFGTDTLEAMTGSTDPAFIIEMDSSGNVIHSFNMQSGGDDMLAITKDPSSHAVYISGDAEKNPWLIGNDTLTGGFHSNEYIFTAKINFSKAGFYQTVAGADGTNCNNACSGAATSYPAGGTPPYTYHWLPGNQTTASVTNLCAGNYTVTVKDANSDSTTNVINVAYIYLGPVIHTTVTPVSCYGLCDGSYTMALTDGGGAMTYTTMNFCGNSSLCAGSCLIIVTDDKGCTAKDTVFITQPPPITASVSSTNATCGACSDGSVSCSAGGGTAPYTYLWQPGNYSGPNVGVLSPGTYTCCVTDANGCQQYFSVPVSFSTGIFINSNEKISIAPNPASGKLFLKSGQSTLDKNIRIFIQNALGETVRQQFYENEIDVSELQQGCYFMELHDGQKTIFRTKFIKQ